MEKFTIYKGTSVPVMNDNIDTDQIIPKQFLKAIDKKGFGKNLFYEWRYLKDYDENPDFILNAPKYKKASLLISGDNFGSGSSREHAAWALSDYGFRAIIAGSYSDIFYNNALKNGLLPIKQPREVLNQLTKLSSQEEITIDLPHQLIITSLGDFHFEIDPIWKDKLINGLDDIGITLQYEEAISAYEQKINKSEPKMTIINLKNVNLTRNKKEILKDITWKVNPGENWVILGLNGSGKSSLLKLILAEEWKTSGEITVLNTQFGNGEIPKLRKRISVVGSFIAERFQPNIKAENLVYTGKFNSSMLYKPYTDQELDEARQLLRQMGAKSLIGRNYASLSQGEKQVLLIARSLILKPELLILDEATNGLDLFAKEKLLKQLQQINQLKTAPTLIYISHHPDEITDIFTHLLLLREGKVIQSGKKENLLNEKILTDFYQEKVEVHRFEQKYFVIPAN
ncbi:3-isopropylmalate dehydratase small subunit [Lactococcus lactis]|uniref:3-isopropylmalate dehydratase small subunit n=5 Tax=Bacteria TaxID=2 RepID=A0A0V8DV61_LACLL|nr:3-isopropylmalate dehydratase small subunit [Lactococcus lactis]KSU17558.1 ABC transporter ATP-binding protein [Lactococcus lactis subsp. lactis]